MTNANNTPETRYVSHEELRAKALENPAILRAYRLAAARFAVIQDIVNLRHTHGFSQSDLAKRASTHQSRISKIEAADHDIRLSTLITLADALDADVDVRLIPRSTQALFSSLFYQKVSPSSETMTVEPTQSGPATKITLRS